MKLLLLLFNFVETNYLKSIPKSDIDILVRSFLPNVHHKVIAFRIRNYIIIVHVITQSVLKFQNKFYEISVAIFSVPIML